MKRIRLIKPVQGRSPLAHKALLAVSAALRSLRDELKDLDEESPRSVSVQTAINSLETAAGYIKLTDRYPRPPKMDKAMPVVKKRIRIRPRVLYHACRATCPQICDEYQQGQSIHALARN